MTVKQKIQAAINAANQKTGKSDTTLTASVQSLLNGYSGGTTIQSLSVTSNGTYTAPSGKAYTPVTVNVPTGTARSSSDLTVNEATVNVPAGLYSTAASKSVASGSAGTPTATKGTVSNHSITVTPSVNNTTGYITGGTKTGTEVTIQASELVSGSETKTANGTYNVTNLAQLVVNVSGSSGSGKVVQINPATVSMQATTMAEQTNTRITVEKAGTYDVYWYAGYGYSSDSTSSQTQLYIDGTATGTATQAKRTGTSMHLEQALTAGQTVGIGLKSASTSRPVFAGNLTIIKQGGGGGGSGYKIDVCNDTVQQWVEIIANIDDSGNIDVSQSTGRSMGSCNNPFATPTSISTSGTQTFRVSWDGDTGIDIQVNFTNQTVSAKSYSSSSYTALTTSNNNNKEPFTVMN